MDIFVTPGASLAGWNKWTCVVCVRLIVTFEKIVGQAITSRTQSNEINYYTKDAIYTDWYYWLTWFYKHQLIY